MKNTLETRLGIFFALALVVAIIVLEMVGAADFFQRGYQIQGTFKNAKELKKGDLVKMAGVEIGRVEDVELVEGQARVIMKIQGKHKIRSDAKAMIKFAGLMGQNFLTIEGGSAGAVFLEKSDPPPSIATDEQPDLNDIMSKLDKVASGVEGLTRSFSAENMSTLLGPITDFMKQNSTNISETMANTRSITAQIAAGKGSIGRMIYDESLYQSAFSTVTSMQGAANEAKSLVSQAQLVIGDARSILDRVNSGEGTMGKLIRDDALYNETSVAMTNLREILQKMNRGEGSVGKLINDDSLFKNAKLSLQKLEKATEGLEDQGPLSVLGIAINNLF
jgi:phospholipid/cholesterol/gamma-HCH transport system substrate-binding protein